MFAHSCLPTLVCVYSSSCCYRCPAAIAVHPPSLCSPLLSAFVCPPPPACIYTIYSYSYPHLYPSPCSLVRACLGPLIHACSHLCPFVWCPFALVCAHWPRLFVLVPVFIWPSFMLICACSVVCPFSLHVASVRAHLCLYQVYG